MGIQLERKILNTLVYFIGINITDSEASGGLQNAVFRLPLIILRKRSEIHSYEILAGSIYSPSHMHIIILITGTNITYLWHGSLEYNRFDGLWFV